MKAYFFPGLGADDSLAPYHQIAGIESRWIRWPAKIRPSWDAFLSDVFLENEIEEEALFLGISFGGLVAVQAAKRKRPKAIILIGSLSSTEAVTPLFKPLAGLVWLLPDLLFNLNWVPRRVIGYFFGIQTKEHLDHFFRMAEKYTSAQTKGLVCLALSAPPTANGSLYAIHGEKDRILPARAREPGYMIKDGGHLLSMTHSQEVNGAILDWLKGQEWAHGWK